MVSYRSYCYRLAALQGHSQAQYKLGMLYNKNPGVTQNYTRQQARSSNQLNEVFEKE